MKNIITLLVILSSLTLTACSKGNGTRTDKPKDKGRGEALSGNDQVFKDVADLIVSQKFDEIREFYIKYEADGKKKVPYKASCYNKNFHDSIYYNLTLPQIAATYAVNSNNTNPDSSIFKYILDHTEAITETSTQQITTVHYSCDNSTYPIHILAAYGHYYAMKILLDFIEKNKLKLDNPSLYVEQVPNPDSFMGLAKFSQHNPNLSKDYRKYYTDRGINTQGDYIRRTPLYTATYYGRYDIIDLLIQKDHLGCYDWEVLSQIALEKGYSDTITEKCKSN